MNAEDDKCNQRSKRNIALQNVDYVESGHTITLQNQRHQPFNIEVNFILMIALPAMYCSSSGLPSIQRGIYFIYQIKNYNLLFLIVFNVRFLSFSNTNKAFLTC